MWISIIIIAENQPLKEEIKQNCMNWTDNPWKKASPGNVFREQADWPVLRIWQIIKNMGSMFMMLEN